MVVIISDGMRYEIAEQLASMIPQRGPVRRLSRPCSALPTTQLGMASLLPTVELELTPRACQYSRMANQRTGPRTATRFFKPSTGAMKAANVLTATSSELRELY